MDINITKLVLRRAEHTVIFDVYAKDFDSSVYMTIDEVKRALEAEYTCVEDCSQYMSKSPHGVRVTHLSSYSGKDSRGNDGVYTQNWYTFPWAEIENGLTDMLYASEGFKLDYTDLIENWKTFYGPQVEWSFGENVKDQFKLDMVSPMLSDKPNDFLPHLERVASNSSNGQLVRIYLSFDCFTHPEGHPHNYYFEIVSISDNRLVMNGGIIAHLDQKTNTYSYSMHT